MTKSRFTYASYIRTTPEALWDALVNAEKTRLYWFDSRLQSDWTVGSNWRVLFPGRRLINSGPGLRETSPTRLPPSSRKEPETHVRPARISRRLDRHATHV